MKNIHTTIVITQNDETVMPLMDHLKELRLRLIKSLAATAIGMAFSYYFIDQIMAFLTTPAGQLYFTKPAEAFLIYMKVTLIAGAIAASPIIFYELWSFLIPAFTKNEKSLLLILVPISVLLFASGILLAYFLILPQGLHFFLTFTSSTVLQPLLSMESYLDFVLALVLPFGFIFEIPLLLIALAYMGLIESHMLKKGRRFIIFISFVVAAIITPTPDVLSQTSLAIPMITLYELSRLIIRYGLKK